MNLRMGTLLLVALFLAVLSATSQESPAQFDKRVEHFLLLFEPEQSDFDRLGPANEVGEALLRILEKNRDMRGTPTERITLKMKAMGYLGNLKDKRPALCSTPFWRVRVSTRMPFLTLL